MAIRLIDRASRWPHDCAGGVDLIRAVNAVRILGKQGALRVLESYLEMTEDFVYSSDQEIVFWIIRLLFEPIRPHDRIPPPIIPIALLDAKLPGASEWPLNPVHVVNDIPFMVGVGVGWGGGVEHPTSHINWARRRCVLRDEPLRPTGNPLSAAEAILKSPQFARLPEFNRQEATTNIRSQAIAMVADLRPGLSRRRSEHLYSDENWRLWVTRANEEGIHWDEKLERFVAK